MIYADPGKACQFKESRQTDIFKRRPKGLHFLISYNLSVSIRWCLMIAVRLIRKIELGPRQMTFGFDDGASGHMDFMYALIEKKYQAAGPVPLDCLIDPEKIPQVPDPFDLLQTVFWLAEALKIHFFISDQTMPPFQAKQMLLENPDCTMAVVINKPVDSYRFDQARDSVVPILPSLPGDLDQYAFSRAVVNELGSWQTRLNSFQPHAEKPGFPGIALIKNSLVLIDRLLENKDSHSIIHACLKYRKKMPELARNLHTLTDFYTCRLAFWTTFTEQMNDFQENMEMIRDNGSMNLIYRQLSNILNSSQPFDLVKKAEELLPELSSFHNQIEQEKTQRLRNSCLEKTDKMIHKLSTLFDTFDTEDAYRNDTLHTIRNLNKKIGLADSMDEITALFNDAQDLFVDIIETL